jgi:hypothetical protein
MDVSDKVFRRKVEKLYPEIAESVTNSPIFTDVDSISGLYNCFVRLVKPLKDSDNEFRVLFFGVILKLYDPDYVAGFRKKVKDGLRPVMAKLFCIEEETVSWWFSQVKGRMLIYKDIADNIDVICHKLTEFKDQ